MSKRRLIIHKTRLNADEIAAIRAFSGQEPQQMPGFCRVDLDRALPAEELERLRLVFQTDINQLPVDFDPHSIRLFVSDMDSTFVNIECIDEIADLAGIKAEVAAITEAAMNGNLDFAAALRQRVALLKGLPVDRLQQIVDNRLRLNPGAERMLRTLSGRGIKTALVSGGFTYFSEILKQRHQLDYSLANVLKVERGRLTGEVEGRIVNAEIKAGFLLEVCEELDIGPNQVVAIGDGANDLEMMSLAGLGIGYHAKEKVRTHANVTLDYCDLGAVCDFLYTDGPVATG